MSRYRPVEPGYGDRDEQDAIAEIRLNEDEPACVIAIDPGDTHVGVSIGHCSEISGGSYLVMSLEMEYIATLEFVQQMIDLGWVQVLVIEDFKLHRDKAMAQVGSRMMTSRMIGALHLMWHQTEQRFPGKLEITMYEADTKKTMRGLLKALGIPPVPSGNSIHARDSQLHFWHYCLVQEGAL
jgi:hypothetical protein